MVLIAASDNRGFLEAKSILPYISTAPAQSGHEIRRYKWECYVGGYTAIKAALNELTSAFVSQL
jgi:hypothetical protein